MKKYITDDGLPTFYSWMMCRYLGQPNALGDIAFDMTYDRSWPLDNKYKSIRARLGSLPDDVMEQFDECWKEYKKSVRFMKELRQSQ